MSSRSLLGALALALLVTACSEQAEGERCDLNSGSLDCEPGLICRSSDQLSIGAGRGVALCCPPDDVAPTVDACRAGANLPEDPELPAEPVDAGDGGS